MHTLFEGRFIFTPEDDKTSRHVGFTVDREYAALLFHAEYSPPLLEDREYAREFARERFLSYLTPEESAKANGNMAVKQTFGNLFVLSIDCGETFVGCGYRYRPRQTIRISPSGSTPGYDPHPVRAGVWRAVIHAQMALSPEIRYSLRVVGVDVEEDRPS